MTTKTVSMRHFRANMAGLIREGQRKNVHFVIMRFGEPIAHVMPMKPKKRRHMRSLEELKADIAEARRQAARGEGYTTEEMRKILGLRR